MIRVFIFLFAIFIFDLSYAQQITKVNSLPYEYSPLFEYSKHEEERFLKDFSLLYLEEVQADRSPEELEKLYNLIRNKDLSVCLNSADDLKNFCSLYLTLFLMGTQSNDLEQFFSYPTPVSDIAILGRAISFVLNGRLEDARKTIASVKDTSIKTYFSDFFSVFSDKVVAKTKPPITLSRQAKIYFQYKNNEEVLDSVSDFNELPASLQFLLGERAFYKGDFANAAELFIKASNDERIRLISLENAFYSFLNANNDEMAMPIIDEIEGDTKLRLKAIRDLKRNKAHRVMSDFFSNDIFTFFFLDHLKLDLKRGANVSYASKLSIQTDNEELLFLLSITKLIYNNHRDFVDFSNTVFWKNALFRDAIGYLQARKGLDSHTIKSLIEGYSLFNYYPFNFFYANIIKNKNERLAQSLYEDVIKLHKKALKEDLLSAYLGLADIYKTRGKYYTAIKLLEEALKFKQNEEEILMEMLRIYALKEDYEELKWRAELLFKKTKNAEHKKELQIFLDLCYEKLGIPKEADTK